MFLHPARTAPDVLAVLETSSLLEVSEFRVFELAWVHWHGVESETEVIESDFLPYMFRESVPHYVRAFTRRVRQLDRDDELEPEAFGIQRGERTARGLVKGLFYSLFVGATVTVLVLLAKVTAERLGLSECMFPPCF